MSRRRRLDGTILGIGRPDHVSTCIWTDIIYLVHTEQCSFHPQGKPPQAEESDAIAVCYGEPYGIIIFSHSNWTNNLIAWVDPFISGFIICTIETAQFFNQWSSTIRSRDLLNHTMMKRCKCKYFHRHIFALLCSQTYRLIQRNLNGFSANIHTHESIFIMVTHWV